MHYNTKGFMKQYRFKALSRHTAIISIMILGNLCLFASNLLAAKEMSAQDFIEFSLYLIFYSLVSSIGLFGSEQILIRDSTIKNNRVYVQTKTIKLLFFSSLISLLITPFIFGHFFQKNIIVLISILFIGNLQYLIYHSLRISGNFVEAQLILHTPRVVLFLLLFNLERLDSRLILSVESLIVISLLAITPLILKYSVTISKKIILQKKKITHKDIRLNAVFAFSLITLTAISFIDKFIAEQIESSSKTLSEFLMLGIILITPFGFLQNLRNFLLLRNFKLKENSFLLQKWIIALSHILASTTGLVIFYVYKNYINNKMFDDSINVAWVIIFITIGVLKLSYADKSLKLGLEGPTKSIFFLNLYTLIIFVFFTFISFIFNNLTILIIGNMFSWGYRNYALRDYVGIK